MGGAPCPYVRRARATRARLSITWAGLFGLKTNGSSSELAVELVQARLTGELDTSVRFIGAAAVGWGETRPGKPQHQHRPPGATGATFEQCVRTPYICVAPQVSA